MTSDPIMSTSKYSPAELRHLSSRRSSPLPSLLLSLCSDEQPVRKPPPTVHKSTPGAYSTMTSYKEFNGQEDSAASLDWQLINSNRSNKQDGHLAGLIDLLLQVDRCHEMTFADDDSTTPTLSLPDAVMQVTLPFDLEKTNTSLSSIIQRNVVQLFNSNGLSLDLVKLTDQKENQSVGQGHLVGLEVKAALNVANFIYAWASKQLLQANKIGVTAATYSTSGRPGDDKAMEASTHSASLPTMFPESNKHNATTRRSKTATNSAAARGDEFIESFEEDITDFDQENDSADYNKVDQLIASSDKRPSENWSFEINVKGDIGVQSNLTFARPVSENTESSTDDISLPSMLDECEKGLVTARLDHLEDLTVTSLTSKKVVNTSIEQPISRLASASKQTPGSIGSLGGWKHKLSRLLHRKRLTVNRKNRDFEDRVQSQQPTIQSHQRLVGASVDLAALGSFNRLDLAFSFDHQSEQNSQLSQRKDSTPDEQSFNDPTEVWVDTLEDGRSDTSLIANAVNSTLLLSPSIQDHHQQQSYKNVEWPTALQPANPVASMANTKATSCSDLAYWYGDNHTSCWTDLYTVGECKVISSTENQFSNNPIECRSSLSGNSYHGNHVQKQRQMAYAQQRNTSNAAVICFPDTYQPDEAEGRLSPSIDVGQLIDCLKSIEDLCNTVEDDGDVSSWASDDKCDVSTSQTWADGSRNALLLNRAKSTCPACHIVRVGDNGQPPKLLQLTPRVSNKDRSSSDRIGQEGTTSTTLEAISSIGSITNEHVGVAIEKRRRVSKRFWSRFSRRKTGEVAKECFSK